MVNTPLHLESEISPRGSCIRGLIDSWWTLGNWVDLEELVEEPRFKKWIPGGTPQKCIPCSVAPPFLAVMKKEPPSPHIPSTMFFCFKPSTTEPTDHGLKPHWRVKRCFLQIVPLRYLSQQRQTQIINTMSGISARTIPGILVQTSSELFCWRSGWESLGCCEETREPLSFFFCAFRPFSLYLFWK